MKNLEFTLPALRAAYTSGATTPRAVVAEALRRIEASSDNPIWIRVLTEAELERYLAALPPTPTSELPLYGIPFAIKDNIDLADIPTTAGCPEYAYTPEADAAVVADLIAAGAIPLGKTNLDQFATGLVGTRSPYGACRNAIDPEMISGGSSSGSAVAVALGQVAFSLGTDTAGSGRVPAFLNRLVGWKPTRGLLSSRGMVPACRSLDCVSVFAQSSGEAATIAEVVSRYDAADAFARPPFQPSKSWDGSGAFRFGVPRPEQLAWFGWEAKSKPLFEAAVAALEALGGERIEIDASPFFEAANLLYGGPWVAERFVAIEDFLKEQADAVFPVTRKIIEGGANPTAADCFKAQYALAECRRKADTVWESIDLLVTPTIGRPYTIAEVNADPIQLNTNLGYYTNFMNLLDLAAVAFPAGSYADSGFPFGITAIAPAMCDSALLRLAARFGGETVVEASSAEEHAMLPLLVCGAHMRGLPLSHQLEELGGSFLREDQTAPIYRMVAFEAMQPPRPGMIDAPEGEGVSLAVEIWNLPVTAVGAFLQKIAPPLGLGTVQMADGSSVKGFICSGTAGHAVRDISELGGWRAYLAEISG